MDARVSLEFLAGGADTKWSLKGRVNVDFPFDIHSTVLASPFASPFRCVEDLA